MNQPLTVLSTIISKYKSLIKSHEKAMKNEKTEVIDPTLAMKAKFPTPAQLMEVISEELVNDRNRRWISVIDANVHQSSCLIAVGALHLPGENGLINLLRKEGYTLKPVGL